MIIVLFLDQVQISEENKFDIDDMNYDSLREQAEQLDLLKYVTGETKEEVTEEVKDDHSSAKKMSIKKKKKRIEDDIEKLKVQKWNKVREYNQKKAANKPPRKNGPKVKDNKITDTINEQDMKMNTSEDSEPSVSSKGTSASSNNKKSNLGSAASEKSFKKQSKSKSNLMNYSRHEEDKNKISITKANNAKDRVLKNKQKRILEEQRRKERELNQIAKQNQEANAQARMRAKNQYRPSSAMQNIFGDKKNIEEEYSLYDQPEDDDHDEEHLERIEEDIEAEDEEDKELKENIKAIDQQIKKKKIKLEETQKQMQSLTLQFDQKESSEIDSEDSPVKNKAVSEHNDSSEEDLAQYLEENEEDEEDEEQAEVYKKFEENKIVVKIMDKIKMLKHRCEAALGYTLFEKAYKLIKKNSEKLREKLCELIGEENIGFYVIFDNILFLENKKKQLINAKK